MKYEIEEWPDGKCAVLVDGKPMQKYDIEEGVWTKIIFNTVKDAEDVIDTHAASQPKRYEYTPKMNPAKADAELGGTRDGREG